MEVLRIVTPRKLLIALMLGASCLSFGMSVEAADTTITVGRFFGSCSDAGLEIDQASGEACIIQAILNSFDAEDNGISIDMRPANWDRYYEQLDSSYDEGTPPDVHILHRHRLHDFVDRGLLASLSDDLADMSVDISDWEKRAQDAVTIGNDVFGIPFDMHANLWHINLAILEAAGLVGLDGRPILPNSPGELLEHARRVKEATGKSYLAADFMEFPIGTRAVLTLLWQQGQNIFDDSGVTINTPEMRAAVTTMTDLFDAGFADPTRDYNGAQQAFLDDEVAVLINGTWAVEFYDREASNWEARLTDYDIADFPTLFDEPATWADSHIWVIPADLKAGSPDVYEAALRLLTWINDHNSAWARTGHLAIRKSVLESNDYATLPHRLDYRQTSKFTRDIPPSKSYNAILDTLTRNLRAIWQDRKSVDEALTDAEIEIDVQIKLQ